MITRESIEPVSPAVSGPELPQGYEAIELLGQGHLTQTLLVKSRESGGLFVARLSAKGAGGGERDILARLDHPALPKAVDCIETDGAVCLIREYVEGISLAEMPAPLPEDKTIDLATQLCDALSYLHGLDPPVIHRDIKPQNVIVDYNGKAHLIDFGIARVYSGSAAKDTAYAGTDGYAPPEQYGYRQTDRRADIFALGMLLCYLATGGSDLEAAAGLKNRGLARIIKKCTGFAPESRFSSAGAVRRALSLTGKSRVLRLALAAAVLLPLMFAAGFITGQGTDWRPGFISPKDAVTFTEPLIEQAARLALDKPEDGPLLKSELDTVTELYFWGRHAARTPEDYERLQENRPDEVFGPIASLEDLALFPNLEIVRFFRQPITDLTPLASIKRLRELGLHECDVEDISPLAGMPRLQNLWLDGSMLADISPISRMTGLVGLDISALPFSSLSQLEGLSRLEYLGARDTELKDLNGYESFPRLTRMDLKHTRISDIAPLLGVAGFEWLHISPDMEPVLAPQLDALRASGAEVRVEN